LITLVNICVSNLFSLRDRGLYFGLISVVWALASGVGPVLGGAFTEKARCVRAIQLPTPLPILANPQPFYCSVEKYIHVDILHMLFCFLSKRKRHNLLYPLLSYMSHSISLRFCRWRWCFWINLPITGLVFFLLLFTLKLETPNIPIWSGLKAVDWTGCSFVIGSTIMLCWVSTLGVSRILGTLPR
jgi:hypothetical protein